MVSLIVFSCEKETSYSPQQDEKNPFKDKVAFNGFEFNNKKYETPRAFVEILGENDSLSADYDGYLTDGDYDRLLNTPRVKDYSVLVYFDLNSHSPSLTKLASGKYTFENSYVRKPGIFNLGSFIRIVDNNKTEELKIQSGTVQVEESNGYILLEYELVLLLYMESPLKGQYTGRVDLKNFR